MAVKVGTETKWVCISWLSSNQPFYNGSHKLTVDEQRAAHTFMMKIALEMK
jgi:CDGSH-type Zn-finger protein